MSAETSSGISAMRLQPLQHAPQRAHLGLEHHERADLQVAHLAPELPCLARVRMLVEARGAHRDHLRDPRLERHLREPLAHRARERRRRGGRRRGGRLHRRRRPAGHDQHRQPRQPEDDGPSDRLHLGGPPAGTGPVAGTGAPAAARGTRARGARAPAAGTSDSCENTTTPAAPAARASSMRPTMAGTREAVRADARPHLPARRARATGWLSWRWNSAASAVYVIGATASSTRWSSHDGQSWNFCCVPCTSSAITAADTPEPGPLLARRARQPARQRGQRVAAVLRPGLRHPVRRGRRRARELLVALEGGERGRRVVVFGPRIADVVEVQPVEA